MEYIRLNTMGNSEGKVRLRYDFLRANEERKGGRVWAKEGEGTLWRASNRRGTS